MDLVTVTYNDDMYDMIRQARSINNFLKPCTHWVIINEPIPEIEKWNELLSKYYKKHTLKLITFDEKQWIRPKNIFDKLIKIFENKDRVSIKRGKGYGLQQVYKLLISKYINDDYLVLDSKNFFIRECSLEDFKDLKCSNNSYELAMCHSCCTETTEIYCDYLKIKMPKGVIQTTTPFLIKNEIIKKIPNLEKLLFWFNNIDEYQSEFLLYSLFEHKFGHIDLNNPQQDLIVRYMLYHEYVQPVVFDHDQQNNHVVILGVHKKFIKEMNEDTKKSFETILKRLNLID